MTEAVTGASNAWSLNKLFNICFKVGLGSLFTLIALGLLFLSIEQLRGTKTPEPLLLTFQVSGLVLALVWTVSTLALWLEGWIVTFQRWRTRSLSSNILLLVFLVFFNTVAAYWLHLLRARRQNVK
jgi:hypothetical protein